MGFIAALAVILSLPTGVSPAWAMTKDDCLTCHSDPELTAESGRKVGVDAARLSASVHNSLNCTDCHDQPANYDDLPHFQVYRKVNCSACHETAVGSFERSFHGHALAAGSAKAPNCCSCHGSCEDHHGVQALNLRTAENACRRCHTTETSRYDLGVHAAAAKAGKPSPGCVSCHKTHSPSSDGLPPSTGAVNKLCESCHPGAMEQVRMGGHVGVAAKEGVMSCASCHDIHETHKPHLDSGILESCQKCHPGYRDQFIGSVHDSLLTTGRMNCLSCHRTHQVTDATEREDFGCGACHSEVEKIYRSSAHRLARLLGNKIAATCASCHGGHYVLHSSDIKSPVNRQQIPNTCGKCHTDQAVVTTDFVRLPISLPNYTESIHGKGWQGGKGTAVCTDCHGTHNLEAAASPTSTIHKQNLAATCGKCHQKVSADYAGSVHGRAVQHGITDSPSCTDCHDEHLIFGVTDPRSPVTPENMATETCAKCHENPEMAARYGLPPEAIQSYEDSYHGWAIKRGGKAVAVCMDCHNKHDIRSKLDPTSSINPNNVVATCGRCHANSNAKFAASYTHILARGRMMAHDWVRTIYIILIVVVLGGMVLHNLIIYGHELKAHYRKVHSGATVVRMTPGEVVQHFILLISFSGLAVTGFALRFPDAWWVKILTDIGLSEETRRIFHRILAMILVGASVYHAYYLTFTGRGRAQLKALMPRIRDALEAASNIAFHLGQRKEHPKFGTFDYTQKAEYWALIWGTAIMSLTGFVLWFPTIATSWLPAWVVRVCEVVHFYEAILAVSAIIIWHLFYVIFLPGEYPMNWAWISGRVPKEQWDHHHDESAKV